MSEDTDEPTHRVVHKRIRRGSEYVEVGEEVVPTDAELRSFPDRFESIDGGENGGETGETGEEESEDVSDAEEDNSSGDGENGLANDRDELSEEYIEDAEYNTLRRMAGDVDGVNGNWGEDRLRAELLEHVTEE